MTQTSQLSLSFDLTSKVCYIITLLFFDVDAIFELIGGPISFYQTWVHTQASGTLLPKTGFTLTKHLVWKQAALPGGPSWSSKTMLISFEMRFFFSFFFFPGMGVTHAAA